MHLVFADNQAFFFKANGNTAIEQLVALDTISKRDMEER
jgi:hypothetical protein